VKTVLVARSREGNRNLESWEIAKKTQKKPKKHSDKGKKATTRRKKNSKETMM